METAAINTKVQDPNALTKAVNKDLGKNEFLKLLLTELRYQDALDPVKDKEFIAQMAQFSALEQTTNMSKEIGAFVKQSRNTEALSLLGRRVTAIKKETGEAITGEVTSVNFKDEDPEITLRVSGDLIAVLPLSEITEAGLAQ